MTRGTDTAGDIHLVARQVLEDAAHCRHELGVLEISGSVGRAAVKIHSADGVSDNFRLFADGLHILAIFAEETFFDLLQLRGYR